MGRRRLLLPNIDEDDEPSLEALNPTPPSTAPVLPDNPQPLEISDDEDSVDVPDAFSPQPPADELRDSPVDRHLRKLGLGLRREWLDSCLSHLSRSRPGFQFLDDAAKSKLCFEQFLFSDMNFSGGGILPRNLSQMHDILLEGPIILQVDETVNISSPLKERYQEIPAGPKRCLKLSLTDGSQRAYGLEYRPISQLKVLAPSGLKIMICNVHVRRGLLILVPEVVEVLGGIADDLEVARGRFVHEIHKPPRGRRSRNEEVLPLSRKASLAAWPPVVNDGDDQRNLTNDRSSVSTVSEVSVGPTGGHEPCVNMSTNSGQRTNSTQNLNSNNNTNVVDVDIAYDSDRGISGSGRRTHSALNLTSNNVVTVADVDMADDVECPLILSGEREIPFTYLACFLAKRAAKEDGLSFIRGKIKCILTGVKSFQFKNRSIYELRVHVDDGSLISEILIDHQVVEKGIGYPPEAVTAALSSSDKAKALEMREIMKRFQLFLMKFEGTMTVELRKDQTTLVAVEMALGFPTSDAWSLLTRLKTFTAVLH